MFDYEISGKIFMSSKDKQRLALCGKCVKLRYVSIRFKYANEVGWCNLIYGGAKLCWGCPYAVEHLLIEGTPVGFMDGG